jgi:circadian clock protein KaiA
LDGDRYIFHIIGSDAEFFTFVEQHRQNLDCLILQDRHSAQQLTRKLYEQGILLPLVRIADREVSVGASATNDSGESARPPRENPLMEVANPLFHRAEVQIDPPHLCEIGKAIAQAISQFLALSFSASLPDPAARVDASEPERDYHSLLMQQQQRLSEKLRERLGYLGVYYKRNPQLFLRHLPSRERQTLLENLKSEYCQIVLEYFSQETTLNQKIDDFVNKAFFADISVSRVVEIHMELMDKFSQQLKLEGRSEEILLDYRLTLIDVIAHLGEMYRRSIPRES